ncbi:beta-lactamase family protein [Rhexocercosporidium sp. MPI-PUGE-AT-0058]|nr:beta-lactamase family protein [Rhexocercosporidium sp. MPI-PUGE-AT-0058]
MRPSFRDILLLSSLGGVCNCDFLGPQFPSPVDLSSNSSFVAAAWKSVSAVIDSYLEVGSNGTVENSIGLEDLSFSIGMFSIHDLAAQTLQYHHISADAKAGPGTSEVTGDSIYRVASVSKLFTVFASLLSFDNDKWDQSILNFIPGISNFTLNSTQSSSVVQTKWKEVTLRALASQIAGIPRDPSPFFSDITIMPNVPNPAALGLPPLTPEEIAPFLPCLLNPDFASCSPASIFEANQARPPTFPAWTTPAYANNGFILLGIALANITGMPLANVYPELIFGPLGMTNSKSAPPPESEWSQYVVPGNDTTIWALQGGATIGSGGLFSSLNDLAKFGTALMNSTLLSPAKTREWMKPVSHTADPLFSVGAPWEIYRYEHPSTGAVTDIYTKLGDAGNYTAFACLIPDYEAGFNVLTSSYIPQKSILAATIADVITSTVLPSLEAQAAAEAAKNFAGTYASTNADLNSSITISFNDSSLDPGLYITAFTSNGTNMIPLLDYISGGITAKLLPSIQGRRQVAFRAVPGKVIYPPGSFLGPFLKMSKANSDWLSVDALTYGGVGMSLFVFDIGSNGRATCVEPAVMKVKLVRTE